MPMAAPAPASSTSSLVLARERIPANSSNATRLAIALQSAAVTAVDSR